MKRFVYTLLIMFLALVTRAQEKVDFINEAMQNLNAPMTGVTGGPEGVGDGVVGAIGGTVSVGGLGAATYTIPIVVPSDIGEIKPNLSVVYNSQSGNGLLGWGWTLGGVSAITRTGATLYQDGFIKGVDFGHDPSQPNKLDRFSLDGQRLMLTKGLYYGENGSEYRTEVDGMSKVVAYTESGIRGAAKFKVWTADGLIMEYGFNDNSRMIHACNDLSGLKEVGLWLLNKVTDRNGNYMLFQYMTGGDQYCLKKVYYTGNENARIEPCYLVELNYEERVDADITFIGNHRLKQDQLLKSIVIKWWENPIAQYDFNYHGINVDMGYFYHRLKNITYSSGGVAYNPTKISWNSNDYNSNQLITPINGFENVQNKEIVSKTSGDFNGDGYADVLVVVKDETESYYGYAYYNNGFPSESANSELDFSYQYRLSFGDYCPAIYVADLDGDGRDDMVTVSRMPKDHHGKQDYIAIQPYLSCWDDVDNWKLYGSYKDWGSDDGHTIDHMGTVTPNLLIGDFLGIGKNEFMIQIPNGEHADAKFLYFTYRGNCMFHRNYEPGTVLPGARHIAADFDGDGIPEIHCREKQGGAHPIIMKMITQKAAETILTDYNSVANDFVLIADFNGDGHADVLNKASEEEWKLRLFKGNMFYHEYELISDLPASFYYENLIAQDFNGDGKADVFNLYAGDGITEVFFSPLVFDEVNSTVSFMTSKKYSWAQIGTDKLPHPCFGNFLCKETLGMFGIKSVFSLRPISNRYSVFSITDGMGNKNMFVYDYLTDHGSNFYFWSKYYDKPRLDIFSIPLPIKALKSVITFNEYAATPKVITEYSYKNILAHRKGHGMLGFKETIAETYINDVFQGRTVTNYTTDALEKHRNLSVRCQSSYNANGRLVSQTFFDYNFMECQQNSMVYVPVVTKQYTSCYNPDCAEDNVLLSKSISEYRYRIDLPSHGSGGLGRYRIALRTPDTYEGMTDKSWIGTVAECDYQTHTHTTYGVENATMLDNWIINRPDTTSVTAFRLGETTRSKSIITYVYCNQNSYQPLIVTSYPGGDLANANGLATSTSYKYDVAGNVTSETLAALNGCQLPRTTTYTYQGYRFRKTEENTMDYVTTASYDDKYGEINWSKDCNEQVTCFNHSDHLGSSEWVLYPDQTYGCTAMRWARNADGTLSDEDAHEKSAYYSWKRISGEAPAKVFYDAAGRELRTVTYALGNKPVYQDTYYLPNGLVDMKTLPYFKDENQMLTIYRYDGLLRQTDTYMPDGTRNHIDYEGLKTSSTFHTIDGETRTTSQTVNFLGQTVESVDADGTAVKYHYYADGKLEWTQVGEDSRTRINLEYDDAGNRTVVHDPNYGQLRDDYDAFGQVKCSTTPKGNVTTYKYDNLGRVTARIETDNELHTNEITRWDYCNSGTQKGLLMNVSIDNKQSVAYKYDEQHLNRLMLKDEIVLGMNYQTNYTYDDASGFPLRVKSVTYPTGYTTGNVYEDETGILFRIVDGNDKLLWETAGGNAMGQVKACSLGNGVTTRYDYYPATARLQSINSFTPIKELQNLSYEYDDFGNLAARYDKIRDLREEFRYDNLDRLNTILLNNVVTGVMTYDNLGRMTSKSADGQPVFRAAHYGYTGQDGQYRPHAINEAQVEGNPFCATSQTVEYTMFDKVRSLTQGKSSVDYTYGYDHERIRMDVASSEGTTVRKTYVGNCEYVEEYSSSSCIERTYLSGPMGVFAVYETNRPMRDGDDRQSESLYYIHKDHLGSWTTITDAHGETYAEQSFDAWGNPRDPETWTGTTVSGPRFDRGFTGHEHLFSFGLINMNGRMYDPVMSSFLSVDNYVQSPENSQNFNRYAYCLNNPLKYTDPSGEELCTLAAVGIYVAISAAINVVTNGIQNTKDGVGFFVGAGKVAVVGAAQGFFSYGIGEVAGAVNLLGSKMAGPVFGKISQASFQVLAHGTVGGVSTMSRGGKFSDGFLSSAVSSAISSLTTGICQVKGVSEGWTRTAIIASGGLSGGVSASIAGGDFWDGVCNGLISSGLNHAMHLVVEVGAETMQILHELKGFQNVMQKDRSPYNNLNMKMCKYAVMEAIAKYFGIQDKNQYHYKKIGDRMEHNTQIDNTQPLLTDIFSKCGFDIEMFPADKLDLLGKALDNGKPVVLDYATDDGEYHAATLSAICRDSDGQLQFQLSDPSLGVHYRNPFELDVRAYYVIRGVKQ